MIVDEGSNIGLTNPVVDRITVWSYTLVWILLSTVILEKTTVMVLSFGFLSLILMRIRFLTLEKNGLTVSTKALTKDQLKKIFLFTFSAILVEAAMLAGLMALNSSNSGGSANTRLVISELSKSPEIALYVVIIAPCLEELVFRQSMFNGFMRGLDRTMKGSQRRIKQLLAALLVALVFAAIHGDSSSLMYVLMSLYLQAIYLREKDIRLNMVVHGALNAFSLAIIFLV